MSQTQLFHRSERLLHPLRFAMLSFVLVGCALGSGCGSADGPTVVKVYPVTGKVVLANGSPLKGGHIWLVPTKDSVMNSSGEIGPDGTFTISTGPSGDGAPPGEFKVRIEPATPVRASRAQGNRPDPRTLPFPEKYLDEDTSELKVTVRADSNQLEPIRLK
jgi:hypothetical protein